jgi:hypothetical protein
MSSSWTRRSPGHHGTARGSVTRPPAGRSTESAFSRAGQPLGLFGLFAPADARVPSIGDHKSGGRSPGTGTRVFEGAARSGARRLPAVDSARRRRFGTSDTGARRKSGPSSCSSSCPDPHSVNGRRARTARADLRPSSVGLRHSRVSPPLKTGPFLQRFSPWLTRPSLFSVGACQTASDRHKFSVVDNCGGCGRSRRRRPSFIAGGPPVAGSPGKTPRSRRERRPRGECRLASDTLNAGTGPPPAVGRIRREDRARLVTSRRHRCHRPAARPRTSAGTGRGSPAGPPRAGGVSA